MGASLTMIDRHYGGHLAHDGREHAIRMAGRKRLSEAEDELRVVRHADRSKPRRHAAWQSRFPC
jgi:hypothetical protein